MSLALASADVAEANSVEAYGKLRAQGLAAVNAGRLREAFDCFDRAWQWAREHGDQGLEDRAFCNRAAVAIEPFGGELEAKATIIEESLPRLRAILVANRDPENCRLAAYNVARIYEHRKEHKKGLFYARISLDRAKLLNRQAWVATSHNQIGNHLLAESFFEQAKDHYQKVLELMPTDAKLARLLATGNLGYCLFSQGKLRLGLKLSYQALREQRHFPAAGRIAMTLHQDLCFGLLEMNRYRDARRHGERSLELAEAFEEHGVAKNVLYLLGQIAMADGDSTVASKLFERVQKRYYPSDPNMGHVLMAFDLRPMINLRA